jgi:maleate cis-trans isomerase
MYGSRGSIGHICPTIPLDMILNEVQQMLPEGVLMVYSSLYIQELRQQDFDRAMAKLDEAAEHMVEGGADCVIVGGGAVVTAIGSDEAVVERTRGIAKVPAISTTGAMLAGLDRLGAKRLIVASPYPEDRNELLKQYLEARGYQVVAMKGLGIKVPSKMARLPFEAPYDLACQAAREAPDADAIYIPGARFPVVTSIGAIERDTGVPVVTSAQALVWWGLRTLGIGEAAPGYGGLFDHDL